MKKKVFKKLFLEGTCRKQYLRNLEKKILKGTYEKKRTLENFQKTLSVIIFFLKGTYEKKYLGNLEILKTISFFF